MVLSPRIGVLNLLGCPLLGVLAGTLVAPAAALAAPIAKPLAQDAALDELEELLRSERAEAERMRRSGDLRAARKVLLQHLEDEPEDHASRAQLARVRLDEGDFAKAEAAAQKALGSADPAVRQRAAEVLADLWIELGLAERALELFAGEDSPLVEATYGNTWRRGMALDGLGRRAEARQVWGAALMTGTELAADDWASLLARARIEQGLGRLVPASRSLVEADRAARRAGGPEADVLVALGDVYFESEREVEAAGKRSAASLYKEALEIHATHEGALKGLFELHRYNRRRQSRSPESILDELLQARPRSVGGLLAKATADLSDGKLVAARETLATLGELAPGRRERRTLVAALAWVEHRREACLAELASLLENAPEDSRPEREVGRMLVELYRFQESIEFFARAVERDPSDYEGLGLYGGALANVGDEKRALEMLGAAVDAAAGRRDAKRDNLKLVLERMAARHVTEDFGELVFSWQPDAAEVLRTYLLPFYEQAREELAERYGFTPGPTTIEIFREHRDFSVRSVGFQGFPALGVCFGPVVTALSPLAQMRGRFSWARTGFHEFSHVVHLGLSHNRCPRWITEGLATWEEVRRSPSWTRNMRRDLVDARAGDNLIPVRELNRAFRGPRILFGYYQGGLLCEMLIDEHGFAPMIRLLEAFDEGLDLDEAFERTFGQSPEEVDANFERFVDERIAGLQIEPRWPKRKLSRLRLSLPRKLPTDEAGLAEWREGWTTIAWGRWQAEQRIDAEEALRQVRLAGDLDPRGLFLRGEMALASGKGDEAVQLWKDAVAQGGRDYRALVGLGSLLLGRGDAEQAEQLFLEAEKSFPGYDENQLSAELRLAELYSKQGRHEDAMLAKERWLAWNAGEYAQRSEVAAWRQERGEFVEAERLWAEASQVDLFRRDQHRAWGDCLLALERFEEAAREYRVARLVPAALDPDHWALTDEAPPTLNLSSLSAEQKMALDPGWVEGIPLDGTEQADLLVLEARCLLALDREDAARVLLREALRVDSSHAEATELLGAD